MIEQKGPGMANRQLKGRSYNKCFKSYHVFYCLCISSSSYLYLIYILHFLRSLRSYTKIFLDLFMVYLVTFLSQLFLSNHFKPGFSPWPQG